MAAERVEVAGIPEPGARRAAWQDGRGARVDLGPAGAGVDVAVLDLGDDPPDWLPTPVPVWPTAHMPSIVEVFGYPLAERQLYGVWRQVHCGRSNRKLEQFS